jgi:hypothetical protein
MLIAGLVLGITGAAYAQVGAGGVAGGVVGGAAGGAAGEGAEIGAGSGGMAGQAGPATSGATSGQAGSEMSGMSKALPGLEQNSPMREQGVPGLGSSGEPRGAAAGSNSPGGLKGPSVPRY